MRADREPSERVEQIRSEPSPARTQLEEPAVDAVRSDAVEVQKTTQDYTKQIWKPSPLLSPVPVVMVTCAPKEHEPEAADSNENTEEAPQPNGESRALKGKANITTVAWSGTICSDPPMLSISLRPATLSHEIIKESMEFVVNVPSLAEVRSMDYCGVVSGRDVDKFEKTELTPVAASQVGAPIIAECPMNIECKVRQVLELGSHTMFIAEVVAVQVTASLIDESGRFALEKSGLAAYAHGHYYALGKQLGHFGFSVRKKTTPERKDAAESAVK